MTPFVIKINCYMKPVYREHHLHQVICSEWTRLLISGLESRYAEKSSVVFFSIIIRIPELHLLLTVTVKALLYNYIECGYYRQAIFSAFTITWHA